MRASEELLALAAFNHPYLAAHQEEEMGHHEWITEDLRGLGVIASKEPINPLVAQLVGAQFYNLQFGNEDNQNFFGYLAFLEGYPATPETVALLQKAFPESTRTIEHHAHFDVEHRADLCSVLNRLADKYHDGIWTNAIESAELYKTALWRIMVQEKDHG